MKLAIRIECDGGCGTTWRADGIGLEQPAITGKRSNGLSGGGMPDGEFHWCARCAPVAFEAARRFGGGVRADAQANGPLPASLVVGGRPR